MKHNNPPTTIKLTVDKVPLRAGLYLVGTPIGYLKDISLRALETFMSVDFVACEDTRVTGKLLHHYGIPTKKIKYNDHSNLRARDNIINIIEQGQSVALCSDAGLPLIADPGYKLVAECVEKGLYVTSIPGANAALTGLQLSAMPTDQFIFLGFLATKKKAREDYLKRWKDVPVTQVYYESARRIVDSIRAVQTVMGERHVVVARELTKSYEEVLSGTCSELIDRLEAKPIKGEVVFIVSGEGDVKELNDEDILEQLRCEIHTQGHSAKEAVRIVMDQSGWPKKKVYEHALTVKNE